MGSCDFLVSCFVLNLVFSYFWGWGKGCVKIEFIMEYVFVFNLFFCLKKEEEREKLN